jgi:hypothetical protein
MFAALDRDGAIIIEQLASLDTLARASSELAPWLARPVDQSWIPNTRFTGMKTLRTSGLIGKSRTAGELASMKLVLELIDRVLGPQCNRFQLSFTQAIAIGPGERAQALHRDTAMYPFRRPGPEVFVNVIWALSDFTADNGGTCIVPQSHRWPDERLPTRSDAQTVAAMPRGSAVVYYGSCYHGGGANRTAAELRVGLAFGYTLGWLRQEENQYLAVPPDVAKDLLFRGGPQRKHYGTELIGGQSKSLGDILRDGELDEEP